LLEATRQTIIHFRFHRTRAFIGVENTLRTRHLSIGWFENSSDEGKLAR
jgi:hypothetical protein